MKSHLQIKRGLRVSWAVIVRGAQGLGSIHSSLFAAVLGAALLGILVAWGAAQILGPHLNIGTGPDQTAPIDLTRLALTVAAGVGGVVALVVAYRRQLDLEQGRFVERFGAAAKQLGDPDVAVRIAGVYAMAGVADQTHKLKRQQCIDVLCGYLRLPYSPELGNNHQTQQVQRKRPRLSGGMEEENHFEYRQNDKEVRQTIIRVIASHLQKRSKTSWSDYDFDFTGAHIENAKFDGATFSGENTSFYGATFSSKNTSFDGATFSSKNTSIIGATFSGENTSFYGATFRSENTSFDWATFRSNTSFDGATFSGEYTSFIGATFSGKYTSFGEATFSGEYTIFGEATFSSKKTIFDGATFSGEKTGFIGATFSGEYTSFKRTNFGDGIISFSSPRHWNPAPVFDWTITTEGAPSTSKPNNVKPDDWPPKVDPVSTAAEHLNT